MGRLVMKFGGTSVADIERISNVALHIKREVEAGNQVAVVVSAMAGKTDELVELCRQAAPDYSGSNEGRCEYDSVVATGEQVTSGLLAIVLQAMGVKARSWTGWQIPVKTNSAASAARISEIDNTGMSKEMADGTVCVVAGFQGISPENRITTLGRGGSDTSAVALAAALEARCDIYTDVDGVYTTDPRIVKQAKKLSRISYEEMLEMASLGAKVLQTRSVELAMVYKVPLQVRSSFDPPDNIPVVPGNNFGPGTLVCDEELIVEQEVVSGIAYSKDEAKVTVRNVKDQPGVSASIFRPLADANISVDMIVQNVSPDGEYANITFTVLSTELDRAVSVLEGNKVKIGFESLESATNVTKVSIVGIGMRSHAGVAATMFDTLASHGINILAITTSEIKTSVLIDQDYTELALRSLHTVYDLDVA
ncbi:Aspartokinase [hydrothermal vent metagenome]|uniref:aspartate kinase n=1 Tax=hydrothermal vent metagenome TaxID=652676 RepID=A0A3B0S3A7_9ZZZZ